jgi:hypothetical protein
VVVELIVAVVLLTDVAFPEDVEFEAARASAGRVPAATVAAVPVVLVAFAPVAELAIPDANKKS